MDSKHQKLFIEDVTDMGRLAEGLERKLTMLGTESPLYIYIYIYTCEYTHTHTHTHTLLI